VKYLEGGKFTVPMGGDQKYRDNWDAIFSKGKPTAPALLPGDDCPCESGKPFAQCHGVDPSEE
jgi:hypothetical protein